MYCLPSSVSTLKFEGMRGDECDTDVEEACVWVLVLGRLTTLTSLNVRECLTLGCEQD